MKDEFLGRHYVMSIFINVCLPQILFGVISWMGMRRMVLYHAGGNEKYIRNFRPRWWYEMDGKEIRCDFVAWIQLD